MPQTVLEEQRIKELFKEALLEVLQERRDLFYDLIIEAIEDMGLARAIQEGEKTDIVGREDVERVLESEP